MIAVLLTVGRWLLGNWTWALPLAAALGLAIDDGLHRIWYADCKAAAALEAARAEEKLRTQRDADAKFTRSLAEQLKPVTDAIQENRDETVRALAKVQSVPVCNSTAAARAFDAGVLPKPGKAPAGSPGPARP